MNAIDRFLRTCSSVVLVLVASVVAAVWLAEWDYRKHHSTAELALEEFRSHHGWSAELVQTSYGGDRLTRKDDVDLMPDFDFPGPTVMITRSYDQEISGFGATLTEASARLWEELPPSVRQQVADLFWGANGLGYTLAGVNLRSRDVPRPDSETGAHSDDIARTSPAMLPLLQVAKTTLRKQHMALKVAVTAGGAPEWMGSGEACPVEWAYHLSTWVRNSRVRGIPVWGVALRRQGADATDRCLATPREQAEFIHGLGPLLQYYDAEYDTEVKLFGFGGNMDNASQWAAAIYKSATDSRVVAGLAFPVHVGDRLVALRGLRHQFPHCSRLAARALQEERGAPQLTHAAVKARPSNSTWAVGAGCAHDIIGELDTGAAGWIDDELIAPAQGSRGKAARSAVEVNTTDFAIHPLYYFVGHFSKYILPRSRRLKVEIGGQGLGTSPYGTCAADDGLQVTAFERPDRKIVAVVLNCADKAVSFKILDDPRAINTTIPAHAIQTYLLNGTSVSLPSKKRS